MNKYLKLPVGVDPTEFHIWIREGRTAETAKIKDYIFYWDDAQIERCLPGADQRLRLQEIWYDLVLDFLVYKTGFQS